MNIFLSGYNNVHNDSSYDEGYLDALCMFEQFGIWTEQEIGRLIQAEDAIIKKRVGE